MKQIFILLSIILFTCFSCGGRSDKSLITGAGQTELYLPKLMGKSVGVLGNHTSMVGKTHLVDSLLSLGVNILKIYSPEHGFRGLVEAGQIIENIIDPSSGLPVVSLYGSHRKPTVEDFSDIDVLLFDLQDVGARFYTYISTLQLAMERCAEMGIKLIILDRPNPNGFYVDGPLLDTAYCSFIGMQPVPVVHGMTAGEYAMMINGEAWLEGGVKCDLEVIPCKNYSHSAYYALPVGPSPNLPNMTSVYLYPSLCFFEGTVVSCGRGTSFPFQLFGHPDLTNYPFSFTPISVPGATDPPQKGELCYGLDLSDAVEKGVVPSPMINLGWLIDAYNNFPEKDKFFNNYFNLLAGNKMLRKQIEHGLSANQIRESWSDDIEAFRLIRGKYLLYLE